jgi:hypothetical protein
VAEIELNERLLKRRTELRERLDGLDGKTGEGGDTDTLKLHYRELKALNASITNLTRRSEGANLNFTD